MSALILDIISAPCCLNARDEYLLPLALALAFEFDDIDVEADEGGRSY